MLESSEQFLLEKSVILFNYSFATSCGFPFFNFWKVIIVKALILLPYNRAYEGTKTSCLNEQQTLANDLLVSA